MRSLVKGWYSASLHIGHGVAFPAGRGRSSPSTPRLPAPWRRPVLLAAGASARGAACVSCRVHAHRRAVPGVFASDDALGVGGSGLRLPRDAQGRARPSPPRRLSFRLPRLCRCNRRPLSAPTTIGSDSHCPCLIQGMSQTAITDSATHRERRRSPVAGRRHGKRRVLRRPRASRDGSPLPRLDHPRDRGASSSPTARTRPRPAPATAAPSRSPSSQLSRRPSPTSGCTAPAGTASWMECLIRNRSKAE